MALLRFQGVNSHSLAIHRRIVLWMNGRTTAPTFRGDLGAVGRAVNRELIHYYSRQKVWLVQPYSLAAEVIPYRVAEQVTAASSQRHV